MLSPNNVRLDVLFGLGFMVDFLLFWFAGTISWSKLSWWRIGVAALVSGLLTVVPVLVPWGMVLFRTPVVFLVSVVLTLIVVVPCSFRQFVAVLGGLWCAAGAAGGVVFLLAEKNGLVVALGLPLWLVAAGVVTGMVGLGFIWQAFRERREVRDSLYRVQIQVGGQPVVLTALLDSGNALCTPVRRTPVAVVEAERLRPYLPPALVVALSMGWDALSAIPPSWQGRCQLVPYSAVGTASGSLLVLAPDSVCIWEGKERRWIEVSGMIGLSLQPLDPQGHYQVLLPPPMLVEVEGK